MNQETKTPNRQSFPPPLGQQSKYACSEAHEQPLEIEVVGRSERIPENHKSVQSASIVTPHEWCELRAAIEQNPDNYGPWRDKPCRLSGWVNPSQHSVCLGAKR